MRLTRALLPGALALVAAACASAPASRTTSAPAPVAEAAPTPPRGSVFSRVPAEIGAFKLTQRAAVQGAPADSIYRFSDGSRTTLSVFIYDIAPNVRVSGDPARWVMEEGERFKEVQAIRMRRGDFAAFTVAFSDTSRLAPETGGLVEHRVATPIRFANGAIAVDMQLLYTVDGRFVKVRATMPQQDWEQSQAPVFARELAARLARAP